MPNWVRTAEQFRTGPVDTTAAVDQEELRALRKRVAELELEKDILRKTAAYFAIVKVSPAWHEIRSSVFGDNLVTTADLPANATRPPSTPPASSPATSDGTIVLGTGDI
ncbi:hypothetical protein [Amycolatopsis sp. NPDC051102]|uniref:hypothetical protein n=1 Tax=Amycolatopsis sp. NPDC051102 TaxID=3155163 RepID=UPI00343F28AD